MRDLRKLTAQPLRFLWRPNTPAVGHIHQDRKPRSPDTTLADRRDLGPERVEVVVTSDIDTLDLVIAVVVLKHA